MREKLTFLTSDEKNGTDRSKTKTPSSTRGRKH